MEFLRNVWEHPRTSVAGLLIAIVTMAGVLSQQGITLGGAGTGTVVSLVGALPRRYWGCWRKILADRPVASKGADSREVGAWALIALLMPLPFMGGCSGSTVARNIVDWTPALQSAVASVDSAGAMLSPGDAPAYACGNGGVRCGGRTADYAGEGYLANPSAGTLAQMQVQVVVLQQQVNRRCCGRQGLLIRQASNMRWRRLRR